MKHDGNTPSVSKIKKANLLDIYVSQISLKETIKVVTQYLNEQRSVPALINYVNAHAFYLSFGNNQFRKALNNSDIVFCDGFGVKLAAKILKVEIGERMTPPDWIDELLENCAKKGYGVYFLGDEAPVVKQFAKVVTLRHPNLIVSGFHHGFFNKTGPENSQVIEAINKSGAQLVITGMGMPIQEIWAEENKSQLQVNAIVATGALFRWYAQIEKRGPRIFTDNGFEWLWRLFVQPKKVWKRYIVELPYFFGVVIKRRAKSLF